jgi:prolyl-tRNA synthetase
VKGVPLRIELGARELADGFATIVRRDVPGKEQAALGAVAARSRELLGEIQRSFLDQARRFRLEHTLEDPAGYGELRAFLQAAGGFARAPWCGSRTCEERVKAETRATIRCLPLEGDALASTCVVCGGRSTTRATWAQAY